MSKQLVVLPPCTEDTTFSSHNYHISCVLRRTFLSLDSPFHICVVSIIQNVKLIILNMLGVLVVVIGSYIYIETLEKVSTKSVLKAALSTK